MTFKIGDHVVFHGCVATLKVIGTPFKVNDVEYVPVINTDGFVSLQFANMLKKIPKVTYQALILTSGQKVCQSGFIEDIKPTKKQWAHEAAEAAAKGSESMKLVGISVYVDGVFSHIETV